MDKVGQSWTKLDKVGQSWTKLDKVGQSWTNLVKVEQSWTKLDKVGLVFFYCRNEIELCAARQQITPGIVYINWYKLWYAKLDKFR